MQTTTITSINTQITYPENVLWLLDSNFVKFEQLDGYSLQVTLIVTVGGNSYYLKYSSELSYLLMRINPLLWSLGPTTFNLSATVKAIGITENVNLGDHYLYYGKSLQERKHGAATIITYADAADLASVQFYNIFSNVANPTLVEWYPDNDPSAVTSLPGISSIIMTNSNLMKMVRTTGATPSTMAIGEIWNLSDKASHTYYLQKVCPKKNGIKLQYYDTDGCLRHAIGEVLTKKMKASREDYTRNDSVFNSIPRSYVTQYTGDIQVGFADVAPAQFLEDIMLSPVITDYTTGALLTPNTLELDRDGETKDIVITFNIN